MNDTELIELQYTLCAIAHRAGQAILTIYKSPDALRVTSKADHSPLTQADTTAHDLIKAALEQLTPDIPVLSEESSANDVTERRHWQRYWLVDPLDGTREFLRRNGEFTVNIALIDTGRPLLSVVEAPVFNQAFSARHEAAAIAYQPVLKNDQLRLEKRRELHCAQWQSGQLLRIMESRSHGRGLGQEWLARLPPHRISRLGSSLKLCRIAGGEADVYLRLGPTSEWDTAAAQLVLECAGGAVLDMEHQRPGTALRYNQRDSLLNPWFIACAPGVAGLFG